MGTYILIAKLLPDNCGLGLAGLSESLFIMSFFCQGRQSFCQIASSLLLVYVEIWLWISKKKRKETECATLPLIFSHSPFSHPLLPVLFLPLWVFGTLSALRLPGPEEAQLVEASTAFSQVSLLPQVCFFLWLCFGRVTVESALSSH